MLAFVRDHQVGDLNKCSGAHLLCGQPINGVNLYLMLACIMMKMLLDGEVDNDDGDDDGDLIKIMLQK